MSHSAHLATAKGRLGLAPVPVCPYAMMQQFMPRSTSCTTGFPTVSYTSPCLLAPSNVASKENESDLDFSEVPDDCLLEQKATTAHDK
jgi:hypothetical protein